MRKVANFIKQNWADPVWSKVFSAGIVAILSSLILFIWSLIKQIPIFQLSCKAYIYLTNNTVELTYFTILISLIIFFILIIPMVSLRIISFQLKNLRVSNSLKTDQFNVETLLNGVWMCEYIHRGSLEKGQEVSTIKEGNKYYISNVLYFVLTDIEISNSRNISWTKTTYPTNRKHSRESLTIVNKNELQGSDDVGYEIRYFRVNE